MNNETVQLKVKQRLNKLIPVEIEMENKWYAYECSIFFMAVCMREYFFFILY